MRIGSIVRLTRPWQFHDDYRNKIGVVVNMFFNIVDGESCNVRFEHVDKNLDHYIITTYTHRLDILEE